MQRTEHELGIFGVLRRVWQLLDKGRRYQLVGLQGLSLLMGLTTLGGIAAIFPFLAVLAEPTRIQQSRVLSWLYASAGFTDPQTFLVLLGVGFVAMVLFSNAVNLLGFLAIDRFAQRLAVQLHVALFEEYLSRDYLFHARTNTATLYSRIIYDCRRLAVGIVHSALTLVTSALTCILILLTALIVNPRIAFAAGVLLGGGYALSYTLTRRRLARNGRAQTRAIVDQTRIVNESLAAAREISLLGRQGFFHDQFRARCAVIADNVASTAAISQAPRHVAEALGAAGLVGVAIWLSQSGTGGGWIAQLSMLALAMYRLLPALQLGFASLARLRSDADGFLQIEADLSMALARAAMPQARVTRDGWQGRPRRSIELQDVSFRYAPDLPPAISEVSLRIAAGSSVGLVGANGSGKSTLADLILSLLSPQSGSIRIDGLVLDTESRASWQASCAYVPQTPLLLDASVLQNVALGVEERDVDLARLREALSMAGLDPLLTRLGAGIHEVVGERGARLAAANGNGCRWRALFTDAPLSWFSMKPRVRSTEFPSRKSSRHCARYAVNARHCSLPIE